MAWFGKDYTHVLELPRTHKPAVLSGLNQYNELATKIGLSVPHILNERFKGFLIEHDIPVYNLTEVVKYMDAKARQQKAKYGWKWQPLRDQDDRSAFNFGDSGSYFNSDCFTHNGSKLYDKVVPMHALRKVELINEHFGDKIKTFVSDYAPKPTIARYPDPFLMALVPLSSGQLTLGEGRYVIDFWNEPGFGLEQQLK